MHRITPLWKSDRSLRKNASISSKRNPSPKPYSNSTAICSAKRISIELTQALPSSRASSANLLSTLAKIRSFWVPTSTKSWHLLRLNPQLARLMNQMKSKYKSRAKASSNWNESTAKSISTRSSNKRRMELQQLQALMEVTLNSSCFKATFNRANRSM